MAVSIRQQASNQGIYPRSISLPAPAIAGSLLIAFEQGNNVGQTPPTGWTQLLSTSGNAIWYKWATGGEQTLTGHNGNGINTLVEFRGVAGFTTGYLSGQVYNNSSGDFVNNIIGQRDFPAAGGALLASWYVFDQSPYHFGTPNGMTKFSDVTLPNGSGYGVDGAFATAYQLGMGAGQSDAKTVRYGSNAGGWWGYGLTVGLTPSITAPGAPASAPTISVNPVNTNGTINWGTAVDPDGDPVTYDVELSTNNGGSYSVIAAGVNALSTVYNFAGQPATTTAKLRVRAKDSGGLYGAYATMAGTFTIQHNVAPNPATWVSPTNGSLLDRALSQTLTFQFVDPDAGDVMTKFDYRYRLVGAATWTTTGTQVGATPSLTIPGGTLAAGNYEAQVLTYDGQGVVATGWSASLLFTMASAPAAVNIAAPTSGSVIGTSTGVAAWTTAEPQTAYQVQRVRDNAGVMDAATVYQDTGIVNSASARDAALNFETNNRYEWIRIRIQAGGLWSSWASVRYQVAYTPPANPALTFTITPDSDVIQVNVANPTPVGTQPVVTKIELWRRATTDIDGHIVTGPDSYAIRVATVNPSGAVTSVLDYSVASGLQYEYQAVITGANNTLSRSAWVS